ncbi:hypothetical protein BC628DRAFT_1416672 [Trametes gibbosa]|nr:hypothetical protein BC628DRAFT_1416672 [Trametes gibbosa]
MMYLGSFILAAMMITKGDGAAIGLQAGCATSLAVADLHISAPTPAFQYLHVSAPTAFIPALPASSTVDASVPANSSIDSSVNARPLVDRSV